MSTVRALLACEQSLPRVRKCNAEYSMFVAYTFLSLSDMRKSGVLIGYVIDLVELIF